MLAGRRRSTLFALGAHHVDLHAPGARTGFDGSVWDLAVGVTIDASAATRGGGYAKRLRITYRCGGDTHTVDGVDAVGIKDSDDCDKYTSPS